MPAANTLYVTEFDSGNVVALPAGGGAPTVLAAGLNLPAGIGVTGGTLHVAVTGDGSVISLPATGGTPTVLAAGLDQPFSVAAAAACTGSLCIPFGS